MKFKFEDKYKEVKKHPFPSDNLPESNKGTKEYYLQAAQAILSRYVNDMCALPYNRTTSGETIKELRDHAEGKQSIEPYKDIIIGAKVNGCRPDSTVKISWKTMDILPKKVTDVENYMAKINYMPQLTGIDKQAIIAKEHIKALTKLAINDPIAKLHERVNEIMGGEVIQQDPELAQQPVSLPFNNEQQVERFAENGGFQLEQEIAAELLLEKTNEVSGFDIIDKMIKKDVVRIGIAGAKVYKDKGSNIIKVRYVDPANAIIPYSIYPDFRDMTYCGEIRRMSIYQLRTETDLSESEIIQIAKAYSTGNSEYNADGFYREIQNARENGLGLSVLDSIEVDVLDCVWYGTKSTRQTRVTRESDGSLALNNVDESYVLKDRHKRKGKELREYSTQTIYKTKYIVGTDKIFDNGQEHNIAFEKTYSGRRVAVFPYTFMKTEGIVQRCISFSDDLQIALFKKRLAIKKMPVGPNITIKKSAFENVVIDNKKMNPAALMKLYTDEGFLIVDDDNLFGNNVSQSKPIEVIPTDVTRQLMECRNEINDCILKIEQVTGVNDAFSGGLPSDKQGLGTTQIALNATGNAIHHLIDAHRDLIENVSKIATHMWRVSSKYMNDKERERLGVSRSLKYIAIGKDLAEFEFDTKLEAMITEEELRQLQQEILQLKDFRRQAGTGGLMPSDVLMLWDIIKSGNVKQARLALSQVEEFRAIQDEEIAQQRYKENAQLQQQSNQQAAENKQGEIEAKGDVDANIELLKLEKQIELERVKGAEKRKEIAAMNTYNSWSQKAANDRAKV